MAIGVLALSYILRQVETEFLKNFQDFAIVTFLYALAIVIAGKIGSNYQSIMDFKGFEVIWNNLDYLIIKKVEEWPFFDPFLSQICCIFSQNQYIIT
jgi:hypothetical protein